MNFDAPEDLLDAITANFHDLREYERLLREVLSKSSKKRRRELTEYARDRVVQLTGSHPGVSLTKMELYFAMVMQERGQDSLRRREEITQAIGSLNDASTDIEVGMLAALRWMLGREFTKETPASR